MSDFDREVRRFRQIAELERKLTLQQKAIRDAKAHVKDLQNEAEATVLDIRAAARDEGELPPL